MEEITIRFEIIRLAVKMADHDTISIQAKKLRSLSLDADLNEIISLLESKNYRQALSLMKGYIHSLEDSFFQTPTPTPPPEPKKSPEQISESHNLFDMMQPTTTQTINLDDMLRMTEESAEETISYQKSQGTVAESYIEDTKETVQKNGAYLNIDKNNIDNLEIKHPDILSEEKDEHYDPLTDKIETKVLSAVEETDIVEVSTSSKDVGDQVDDSVDQEKQIEIDLFSQEEDIIGNETNENELILPEENIPTDEDDDKLFENNVNEIMDTEKVEEAVTIKEDDYSDENTLHEKADEIDKIVNIDNIEKDREEEHSDIRSKEDYIKENRRYPPISYIDQKFRNMRHQFPQIDPIEEITAETQLLLKQIATKGYSENDIKDMIVQFQKKKAEGKKAEAAEILLIAAASESKYAQLLLARELFRGEVLKIDYPEAFTQINRLAEYDYPEAICDLAQLYEYGYGIKKDRKTALLLYEEAYSMGVERAQKHVERLGYKKGLLGSLFKR